MKNFVQGRRRKTAFFRASTARVITSVVFAGAFTTACENGVPTTASIDFEPFGSGPAFITTSNPPSVPVTSVPQSRPYPGTRVQGQGSVCKDASSPAGTYTFNVSVAVAHTGDLVASSVTLSPGQCAIVYNRHGPGIPGRISPVTNVTVTEVVPAQSTYRVDRVLVDDDFSGPRTLPGPSVTFGVNAYHGGYANFFNVLVDAQPPPALVNLGNAGTMGILAGTTVTCVAGGVVNADIGISPGSALTGFGPCLLTGTAHLADAYAAQAQLDLTAGYNALAALPCPPANVISANIGGTTKAAGVYCSATSIGVTGTLTLDGGGNPNATFVFQAGSTLTTAGNVVLINGAQARNVFFQVGSSATLGTGSQLQGNILALTSITLNDNVTLIGRALARNGAVTLGTGNVITLP
jgi:hypothetical protein